MLLGIAGAYAPERRSGPLLRADLRAHHYRSIRRNCHRGAQRRKRPAGRLCRLEPAQSASCRIDADLSSVARRYSTPWSDSGPSSISLHPCFARHPPHNGGCRSWRWRWAPARFRSNYYLQVLKRVYVVKPAQTGPLQLSLLELTTLVAIALAVAIAGSIPERPQRLDSTRLTTATYCGPRSTVHTEAQTGPPMLNVAACPASRTCSGAGTLRSNCHAAQPIIAIPGREPTGCPFAMRPPEVFDAAIAIGTGLAIGPISRALAGAWPCPESPCPGLPSP